MLVKDLIKILDSKIYIRIINHDDGILNILFRGTAGEFKKKKAELKDHKISRVKSLIESPYDISDIYKDECVFFKNHNNKYDDDSMSIVKGNGKLLKSIDVNMGYDSDFNGFVNLAFRGYKMNDGCILMPVIEITVDSSTTKK